MLTQIGAVTGIQVLHTVQQVSADRTGLAGSYGNAFLVGACFAAGAAAVALLLRPGRGASGAASPLPASATRGALPAGAGAAAAPAVSRP